MIAGSRLITSVGYMMATASLCSLVALPATQALAAEGSSDASQSSDAQAAQSSAVTAVSKNETVNISTQADGTVKKVEVSTTLESGGHRDIVDATNLTDLKADDEDVYYTDDGQLVWHSPNGENITYTGVYAGQLPIEVRISYRLDGELTSPKDLVGKSGHVVIRYDYLNNSWTNGGGFAVYTPFTAITGMLLDTEIFSNVKVKNGKLIDDADRTIAIGYAMPGLAKTLDAGDSIEIPDYFEVEADVVDFELASTLTMVSPDMLADFDVSDFDTDEYADASKGLKDAMCELIDGSSSLTDGLNKLAEGNKELADGISALDGGLSATTNELPALKQGISQMHGASSQLVMLADGLLQGLAEVKTSTVQVRDGASQLAEGLSGDGVKALTFVLQAASQELEADIAKVEAINAQADVVVADAGAAAGALASYQGAIEGIEGLTEEQKAALLSALAPVESSISQVSADAQALKDADKQLSATAVKQAAGALGMADFSALSEGAKKLADGLDAIVNEGFGTAEQQRSLFGAATLMRYGAASLDQGLATFEGQSDKLVTGISELASGVSQLVQGSAELADGAKSAAEGSSSMTEGLRTFNGEGISKITDAIDNKLVKLGKRFKAAVNESGSYNNIGGIADGTAGSVKFVFETDAIEL